MLNIDFFILDTNEICGFEVSGHADYGTYGNDIICAGVSSVCYMVVNTIVDVMKINADVKIDDIGYMYLRVNSRQLFECQVLFKGLKEHLLSMGKMYPENLMIKCKVV